MKDSDALLWQEINHIAQVLEIAAPVEATAEERRQWVAWWTPSYESALKMTDEHKAILKNRRWWPPLCGSMIDGAAPEIEDIPPRPLSRPINARDSHRLRFALRFPAPRIAWKVSNHVASRCLLKAP